MVSMKKRANKYEDDKIINFILHALKVLVRIMFDKQFWYSD